MINAPRNKLQLQIQNQDLNLKNRTWSNNEYEIRLIQIWNSHLLLHETIRSYFKKLLLIMTNLLMISSNGNFSSDLKNLHMHQNSPNICLPVPPKATPFLILNFFGITYVLPSANIYQQTRADNHQISHIRKSQHIFLYPTTIHTSYIIYRKRKL